MHIWSVQDTIVLIAGVSAILIIAIWFSKVITGKTSTLDKYAKATSSKPLEKPPVRSNDPFVLLNIDLDKKPYVVPEGCKGIENILYFISGNDRQILELMDQMIDDGDFEALGFSCLLGKMINRLYGQHAFHQMRIPFPTSLYIAEMDMLYEKTPRPIFEAMVALRNGEGVIDPDETYTTVHCSHLNKLYIASTILEAIDKFKSMD